jgi:hypothetical protein
MTDTTYEEIVATGQKINTSIEQGKWDLGDLANVIKLTGLPISDYAKDVGCAVRSLQDWAVLAWFYPPDRRDLYPNLSYTHYRDARRAAVKVLEDLLDQRRRAHQLLALASDKGWTIEQFEYELATADTEKFPAVKIIKIEQPLWDRALAVIRLHDPALAQEMETYL